MITIKMTYEKSTKNTYVYKSDDDQAAIPILYIKKDELSGMPDKIEVSIHVLSD